MKEALARVKPKVVAIVMAETSTGAWQPIEEIAAAVRDAGAMLILDTVTALGGIPVEIDKWQIDAVYSGTQKCLSCPPGLAPVSFSDRAVEKILKRREKVRSWYLDVSLIANYWGGDRVYHHTAPINMTYALHEALRLVLEEGLEACFARHRRNHEALKAGLAAIGIEYATQAGHELPQLNAVRIPAGVDDAAVRKALLERFGIEIGAGLGAFKGKVWRIGLMGYASRQSNVLILLAALEQLLAEQGHRFEHGARRGGGECGVCDEWTRCSSRSLTRIHRSPQFDKSRAVVNSSTWLELADACSCPSAADSLIASRTIFAGRRGQGRASSQSKSRRADSHRRQDHRDRGQDRPRRRADRRRSAARAGRRARRVGDRIEAHRSRRWPHEQTETVAIE